MLKRNYAYKSGMVDTYSRELDGFGVGKKLLLHTAYCPDPALRWKLSVLQLRADQNHKNVINLSVLQSSKEEKLKLYLGFPVLYILHLDVNLALSVALLLSVKSDLAI